MTSRSRAQSWLASAVVLCGLALLTGCGQADGDRTGADPAACTSEATGDVVLAARVGEWFVTPSAPAVPAGPVVISVRNVGREVHELVVVRVDGTAARSLVRSPDGSLDEAALPAGSVIGEIEGVPPGGRCSAEFDLPPGQYELLCDIVATEPDGSTGSHLHRGMVAPLTVV
jgi:hypothetical protein